MQSFTFRLNRVALWVLFSICLCSVTNKLPEDNSSKEEWISLFNGKDINNWFVKIQHHETGENYGNTFVWKMAS
jgi:hypothetical protein